MRLNYKYTVAYAVISLVILVVGFSIEYVALERSTLQTTIGKLRKLNTKVAAGLAAQKPLKQPNVSYQFLDKEPANWPKEIVKKRLSWNPQLLDSTQNVAVTTLHFIGHRYALITSNTFIISPDTIYWEGILLVFAWTFIFLLAIVIISSEILSGYILAPFYSTLQAMRNFAVHKEEKIRLEQTSTYEFDELQAFLATMAEKAKKEYKVLKEFSENASHELQTPIAVMKSKLELLIQTDLTEEQLLKITSVNEQLQRLSKINEGLVLLAKLENYEHSRAEKLDLSGLLRETISSFEELAEMRNIHLQAQIADGVSVACSADLYRILLNNLLSNSLKHNQDGGTIEVKLSPHLLLIRNTGDAPLLPTEDLFGRFRKGNNNVKSVGIGLAIVRKITEIYGQEISYQYADSWHTIRIKLQ